MPDLPRLTDRDTLAARRARACRRPETFLQDIVADEIEERLGEVNKVFRSPVVITGLPGIMPALLPDAPRVDDNPELPLSRGTYDLVVHTLSLHWADDPVGQIVQSRLALEPDGLFLAAMFGGRTLNELRTALAEAETRLTGGLSPRVAPMGDVRDLGHLVARAGLALPVADVRTVTATYATLDDLVRDLRGMGETNALASRDRRIPTRRLFALAEEIYRQHFSEGDRLLATFDIVFLTGWAPSETQPRPLRPGSATARLADALGVPELSTGDPANSRSDDTRSNPDTRP